MLPSFFIANTGVSSYSKSLAVVGNNIANINTPGFKGSRIQFEDLLVDSRLDGMYGTGRGVQIAQVVEEFSQGSFENTQTSTDLAISGNGFFIVHNGWGNLYTRSGQFRFDENGYLKDTNDYNVQGFAVDQESGESRGVIGDIRMSRVEVGPKTTTELKPGINLDSSAKITGFRIVEGYNDNIVFGDSAALVGGTGSVTAIANTVLTDTTRAWTTDQHKGHILEITSGPAEGKTYVISSNSATTLTCNNGTFTADGIALTNGYRIIDSNTAILTPGTYSSEDLSVEIGTQLTARSPNNQVYSASYDDEKGLFTITNTTDPSNTEDLRVIWANNDNGRARKLADLLGFNENDTVIVGGSANSDILAGRFDPEDAANTSNFATSMVLYDSLGTGHVVEMYFRKSLHDSTNNRNQWEWFALTQPGESTRNIKIDSRNDRLAIAACTGTCPTSTANPLTWTFIDIKQQTYTPEDLADELTTKIQARGGLYSKVSVSYDNTTGNFTFTNGNSIGGSATQNPIATVFTDTGAGWTIDALIGGTLEITSGTAKGKTYTISDNTATTITVQATDDMLSDGFALGDTYKVTNAIDTWFAINFRGHAEPLDQNSTETYEFSESGDLPTDSLPYILGFDQTDLSHGSSPTNSFTAVGTGAIDGSTTNLWADSTLSSESPINRVMASGVLKFTSTGAYYNDSRTFEGVSELSGRDVNIYANDRYTFVGQAFPGLVDFDFINGATLDHKINFNWGSKALVPGNTGLDGTTQFDAESVVNFMEQDGYGPGSLIKIAVDRTGLIQGMYTNGQVIPLSRVAMANFASPVGLTRLGSNLWTETLDSGQPVINDPGMGANGTIQGKALELSNVDLAREFVDLIRNQRGFQANARVMTTTNDMLADLMAMIR